MTNKFKYSSICTTYSFTLSHLKNRKIVRKKKDRKISKHTHYNLQIYKGRKNSKKKKRLKKLRDCLPL